MQKSSFGIDFGTTNTTVSRILYDSVDNAELTYYGEDRNTYPFASILAIHKKTGDMLFGREVKRHRMELEKDYFIASSFKSLLGTDETFYIAEKRYTSVDLVSNYLILVKQYIKDNYDVEIKEATFALPIGFSPKAREGLQLAAERAKIKVTGFIGESTAAYVANRKSAQAFTKAMVIDFGGGTIDISILDIKGNELYEASIFGEKCGGDDIDIELAKKLHGRLLSQTGKQISFNDMENSAKDAMISNCEAMKIEMTFENLAVKRLRNYLEKDICVIELEYDFFKGVITPIINQALNAIKTAMMQARVSKESIEAVILVGGSSDIRPYYQKIQSIFGAEKIIIPDKMQWSVAAGAAYIGLSNTEYLLSDDLCVLLSDGSIYKIFEKNKDKVGSKIKPITFSTTEQTTNANFIFVNSDKTNNYGFVAVPSKGFLKESITLSADISSNQIATIKIFNKNMGQGTEKTLQISNLKFHYNLELIRK